MKQNLLIVTEHYPCGTQESFLENEINELKKLYRVHVITMDLDRLMSQSLPKDVVFFRPVDKVTGIKRLMIRLSCRFSKGYQEEAALAKAEGRWTPEYQKHLLGILVKSRILYNYIRAQDLFEQEEPLLIYSTNFNDYLYGLCCLKDFSDDIRVVTRCHNANMFDPRTGRRRDTLNGVINRMIDGVYFTSEHSRQLYLDNFVESGEDVSKFRVAKLGVPGQEKGEKEILPEFFLRVVSCSPVEKDKRLKLIVDGLEKVENGCVEWVHIGSGSGQKELAEYAQKKLAGKKGLRYRFLGHLTRKEIYQYYQDTYIDMFLSVSMSESVPTAMLEAMANHIFVAATSVDGVSAVVNNQNGLLLPVDVTANQLGKVLDALCRISKDEIAKKGEAAYRSWKKNFDAEKNCAAFSEELALVSGQSQEEIEENRAEFDRKLQIEAAREQRAPLQTPAFQSGIHEMPLSFRESLRADGLLRDEEVPENPDSLQKTAEEKSVEEQLHELEDAEDLFGELDSEKK